MTLVQQVLACLCSCNIDTLKDQLDASFAAKRQDLVILLPGQYIQLLACHLLRLASCARCFL